MSTEKESLELDQSILGGTDDWGDEDLVSIDDLDEPTEAVEEEVEEEEVEEEEVEEESEDDTEEDDATDDTETEDEADEEDTEVEEEADEESHEDLEDEDEKPAKKQDNRVPRSRLNQEVDKRRALEARIAELESSAPKARAAEPEISDEPAFTLDDFKAMSEAILDGDDAKALEKFSSMTQAQVNQAVKGVKDGAREEARHEIQAAKDTDELHSSALEVTQKYPEFDSNSEQADKALIEEVLELRNAFEVKGLSPAKALAKASRLVALDNELTDQSVQSITDTKAKRGVKKPDIKKKLKLAAKEKGKLAGAANRGRKLAKPLGELSDADFNAASEDALARARGDFL